MRPYQEFQNPETGEYNAEYLAFEKAVIEAGCKNFDCNQIALAIKSGISVNEAVAQFDSDYFDNQYEEDFEDRLNHDMSMNA